MAQKRDWEISLVIFKILKSLRIFINKKSNNQA